MIRAWWLLGVALAHPTAVTIAEAEHRDGRLEIAFQVAVHDLRAAAGELDEPRVAAWLADHFYVEVDGKRTPHRWVGMEAQLHDAWLYFEIPLPKLEGATLYCRAFFEQAPTQVNTVNLKVGGALRTLTFTASGPGLPLKARPARAAPPGSRGPPSPPPPP